MLLELQSSTHSLHGAADRGERGCGYAKLAAATQLFGVDVPLEKGAFFFYESKGRRVGTGMEERGGLIKEQEMLTKELELSFSGREEENRESLAELLSSTDQDVVTHLE